MAPAVTEARPAVRRPTMGGRWNLSEERWRSRAAMLAISVVGIGSAALPGAALARTLPDGRAYELVSAVDKNGGDASSGLASSPDGNRLAYYSIIGFAGADSSSAVNSYVAQRGSDGWATRMMQPKIGAPNLALTGGFHFADFTDDLSKSITLTRSGAAEPAAQNVFITNLDGSSAWVTAPTVSGATVGDKSYVGRTPDASHIVFESSEQYSDQVTIQGTQVWEWVNGRVRLVSILPDGSIPSGGAGAGSGSNGSAGNGTGFGGTLTEPSVISEDGRRIFFGRGGNGVTSGVFVREDGARTRELSLSQRAGTIGQPPVQDAVFAGASADGNVAVFTSLDQLTDDATPNGGIYAFDLRSGVLKFVSSGAADPNGAQVEGVSLVSHDGSRIYFVAQAVLVPGHGVAGGRNLYVADANGVSFIATRDAADDAHTRATPDGRYFVFQSYAQATNIDNVGHSEIYVYDAVKHSIACVSCGSAGHAPAGDASIVANPVPRVGTLISPQTGRGRTITDDGSRIYFQTTDGLVPEDVNGVSDVYEYDVASGSVALLSAGTGGYDSEILDNTPDGHDVFFFTRDGLVKRDIDGGGRDVYDARVGGGFADPPDVTPCSDDACQPIPGRPPSAPAPSTGTRTSGGVKDVRAPRLFVQKITTTGRKNVLKTGRLTLVTNVEAAGTVSAAGTASYGNHTVYKLKSVKATLKKAGTKNLQVLLPSAVRSQLKHHHKVKLSITVSYNKATAPVHVALTLS
jgi:hypothetical protein